MLFSIMTIRNGVTACLMLAALALLVTGSIGPLHSLLLANAILYGRWGHRPRVGRAVWDGLAVAALLAFPFDLFFLSRDLIASALRLLTFVVIYRCCNLDNHRDLRQAVSLSFIQIVAAAASTTELHFALFLGAYLFMATWTLMAMASARDEAPAAARRPPAGLPTARLTAAAVAFGSAIFFLVPHFGTGYFQPGALAGRQTGDGLTGFSERIELGTISRIRQSRAIVMRARVSGMPPGYPLRWRGVALDHFDGHSWSASQPTRRIIERGEDGAFAVGPPPPSGAPLLTQEIDMMPVLSPVLFVAPQAARVETSSTLTLGLDYGGGIHLSLPRTYRFHYRVVSLIPAIEATGFAGSPATPRALDDSQRALNLTLPAPMPGVAALTSRVASGAISDFERARRIEDYLRANHAYTLEVNDTGLDRPVETFLMEKRAGHCEYFATGMAVMLRHLGIPARVVTGLSAGEWSAFTESWIVRQSDAHAWVEAWIPERGWVTFDPTPSRAEVLAGAGLIDRLKGTFDRLEVAWDTWVIGLDLLDQQSLAASLYDAAARLARSAESLTAAAAGLPSKATALLVRLSGWNRLVVPSGVLLAAGLSFWIARRILGRRSRPTDSWLRVESRWARRGLRRQPGQTPLELAREAERLGIEPDGEAVRLALDFYGRRFGRLVAAH